MPGERRRVTAVNRPDPFGKLRTRRARLRLRSRMKEKPREKKKQTSRPRKRFRRDGGNMVRTRSARRRSRKIPASSVKREETIPLGKKGRRTGRGARL